MHRTSMCTKRFCYPKFQVKVHLYFITVTGNVNCTSAIKILFSATAIDQTVLRKTLYNV